MNDTCWQIYVCHYDHVAIVICPYTGLCTTGDDLVKAIMRWVSLSSSVLGMTFDLIEFRFSFISIKLGKITDIGVESHKIEFKEIKNDPDHFIFKHPQFCHFYSKTKILPLSLGELYCMEMEKIPRDLHWRSTTTEILLRASFLLREQVVTLLLLKYRVMYNLPEDLIMHEVIPFLY